MQTKTWLLSASLTCTRWIFLTVYKEEGNRRKAVI